MQNRNEDERAALELADFMMQQAKAMMREAEKALEGWKVGKEMNRQRCARRGINTTDAEIRWAASAVAKNAITNNSFHVSLATMYYGAATASYARAQYLRRGHSSGTSCSATEPGCGRGGSA